MAGTAQLLQLLSGSPTQAAVGALLAGAGAQVALAFANPARCYVYRQPYDEDVFQAATDAGGIHAADKMEVPSMSAAAVELRRSVAASSAAATPGANLARSRSKLHRPVGYKALARLFSARNVAVMIARNEGLTSLLVLNRYFQEIFEEEERAELMGREPELPPFPVPLLRSAAWRGLFNSGIEWLVQLVRAGLDTLASSRLSPSLASSLIKDLKASARRKAERYAWWYRAYRVTKTSLYSEATLYCADTIVACGSECVAAAWHSWGSTLHAMGLKVLPAPPSKPAAPLAKRLKRLGVRCGLQATRAGACWAAVSAGNGVGSASPVARGLAMFLCANAASFLVNSYMGQLMQRLTSSDGDEGSGTTAAAGATSAGGAPPRVPPVRMVVLDIGGQLVQVDPEVAAAIGAAAAQEAGGGAAAAGVQAGGVQADPAVQAAAQLAGAAGAPADAGAAGAAVPDAAEPQPPEPQQRRPVGPRLPDRPARRQQAAAGAMAPPPAAPSTPHFKDNKASQESEEVELSAAAARAAAADAVSPSPLQQQGQQP